MGASTLIVLAVIVVVALWVVAIYNGLVSMRHMLGGRLMRGGREVLVAASAAPAARHDEALART